MSVLVSLIMIFIFFFQGRIFEVLKKIIFLIIKAIFFILKLLGIKINIAESRLRTSRKFKETFKEIKVVRESKENAELKPSINIATIIIFMISLAIIVINLKYSIITKGIYSLKWVPPLFGSEQNVDTMVTAITFSFISLSLSSLLGQWKETKNYRKAKKEMRNKNIILKGVRSRELLRIAKEKDQEILNNTLKNNPDRGDSNA